MAKLPQYDEQPSLAAPDFRLPGATQQARSFDRLQSALGRWQERAHAEADARAMEVQRQAATRAQAEAAPGELVAPPDRLSRRYQEVFRERAKLIYDQQLALDATRTAFDLKQKHYFNPDGFAEEWGAYVQGQEEVLTGTDPAQAVDTRLLLEDFGMKVYHELAGMAYTRERDAQANEALELFRRQLAAHTDQVLRSGDEQDYYEGLFQVEGQLDILQESGLVGAAEVDRLRQGALTNLSIEFLTGRFRNSLRADDIGGAQAVIDSLQAGKWFRHNPDGRALADSLARELAAHMKAAEGELDSSVGLAMYELQRMTAAQLDGVKIDDEAFDAAYEFVLKQGNPKQQRQAQEYAATRPVAEAVGGKITQIPYGAVRQTLDDLRQAQLALAPEAWSRVESMMTAHQRDLEAGMRNGLIPPSLEFDDISTVPPEAPRARQVRAAALYNVPVNAIPLWSPAEQSRFSSDISGALRNQDYHGADALLTAYSQAYGEDLGGVARGALALGEAAPGVYLPTLLHAMGEGGDLTTDALALAGTGQRADQSQLFKLHGADPEDLRRDRNLARQVWAASMGDAHVAEDMYSFLTDVYAGVLARTPKERFGSGRTEALREVRRIMSPFQESVEFANGSRLPAKLLANNPRGAQEVVAEVNRYLDDPRLFDAGFDAGFTEDFARNLSIRPAPEGGVGFWHTTQGAFLRNRDGDIVTVARRDTPAPTPDAGGLASSLKAGLQWAGEQAKRVRQRLGASPVRVAAANLGVSVPLLEGIYYAAQDTPAEELEWRTAMALPDNADAQTDWKPLRRFLQQAGTVPKQEWDTINNADAQPYAAAQRLKKMQTAFPGDDQAQLAAYFDSPELVRELQKEYGSRWFVELPLSTQSFVHRAQRYAARRAQE